MVILGVSEGCCVSAFLGSLVSEFVACFGNAVFPEGF